MTTKVTSSPKPQTGAGRATGPIDSLAQNVAAAQARLEALQNAQPVDPKKVAQAQAEVKTAKATLESGVAGLSTGTDAKADAKKVYDALQVVNAKKPELQAAHDEAMTELHGAMAQADQAKTPKEKDAAITRLKRALAKTNGTSAALVANAATAEALTGQLGVREQAALKGSGRDLADVALEPTDRQVDRVGAPVVSISSDQAVEADRKKVSLAVKSSASSAAKMLLMQLQGADKYQQEKLVSATANPKNNILARIAEKAAVDPATANTALDALGTAQGTAKIDIAKAIAKQTTLPSNAVFVALDARMKNGEGFEEAAKLSHALRSEGKTALADQLDTMATGRMRELRTKFGDANEKVKRANGDLARLVAGFGPMLTDAQKLKAIDAFKARHKPEFDAFEATGTKLGHALSFVTAEAKDSGTPLQEEANQVLKLLPDIGETRGGGDAIVHALEQQKEGEETFLDRLPELMTKGKEGKELAERISNVMVKNVGRKALALTAGNKMKDAEALIGSLSKNAKLFGVDEHDMEGVVESLKHCYRGDKGAFQELNQRLTLSKAETPGFSGRGAQGLKGLALLLSIPGNIETWKKGDLGSYVGASAEALNLGLDGGVLAIDVLGKSADFARFLNFAKGAGGGLNAVGAVVSAISAGKAFARGDYGEGVASSASAAGGAILATAAISAAAGVQVIPAAGQVIGAVLVVGGMVGGWIVNERHAAKAEKSMEDDAQAFLEATGVDPARADELSDLRRDNGRNVGPFVQQLAKDLGMSPQALWQHLLKLSPHQLDAIVDMAKDLPFDKEGNVPRTAGNDDSFLPPGAAVATGHVKNGPQSIKAAEEWMRREDLLPRGK